MIRRAAAALWLAQGCGEAPAADVPAAPAAIVAPTTATPREAVATVPGPAPQPTIVAAAIAPRVGPPPPGLVDLRIVLPQARFAIGYATADNFTGAPLPGYDAPGAWAHAALGDALVAVDRALVREGLGLLVYDAYRPRRASAAMVAWARRSGRQDLLDDGYIAARSQHNRGLAVDVTLVERPTGTPLAMGTAWDAFTPHSATFAVQGEPRRNRERLRAAMLAAGLRPHDGEWWHFALPHATAPVLDVAYAR